MKKAISIVMIVFALLLALTACGKKGLPAWADTEQATAQAQQIIGIFNRRDFDGVAAMYNSPDVTREDFEANLGEVLSSYGNFLDFGKTEYSSASLEDGTEYITVSQIAKYENGQARFNISFFQDGSLAGFYMLE